MDSDLIRRVTRPPFGSPLWTASSGAGRKANTADKRAPKPIAAGPFTGRSGNGAFAWCPTRICRSKKR